jgi:hypothetical protein
VLAISVDGVMAPIRGVDKLKKAEQPRKHASGPTGYKEVGCSTVCLYDREAAHFQTGCGAEATLAGIFQRGVMHIYAGGGKQSFDKERLVNRLDWYEILLRLPKTQIYRVVGCR